MRSVRVLGRITVLLVLVPVASPPPDALAQDSTGRPTVTSGDPAKPRGRRSRGRPKKVIRSTLPSGPERVPTASIIIRSYPPDAEVFVDGNLVGTTADDGELELSELRLGQHRIVLRKEGFREWAQTVTLRATEETQEFEPLLQSESSFALRDLSKLPAVHFGERLSGQITRDGVEARDGSGFYNEYVMRVAEPGSVLFTLAAKGTAPTLRIVDESNRPYPVQRIGEGVFQSGILPQPGVYFLQVLGAIDQSTYVAGEYAVTAVEERVARGEAPLAIGESDEGALEPTDRESAPGEYYDVWRFDGQPGARVRVAAESGTFTPGVTVRQGDRVVASSGAPKKGKKKGAADPAVDVQCDGGAYTVYVRSVDGAKVGPYRVSITPQP